MLAVPVGVGQLPGVGAPAVQLTNADRDR